MSGEFQQKYYEDLEQQNEALLAQVEELRECLPCSCGDIGFFVVPNVHTGEPEQEQCEHCYTNPLSRFNVLAKTPQQSLDSLKARIISSLLDDLKDYLEEPEWNHLDHSIRDIMK